MAINLWIKSLFFLPIDHSQPGYSRKLFSIMRYQNCVEGTGCCGYEQIIGTDWVSLHTQGQVANKEDCQGVTQIFV